MTEQEKIALRAKIVDAETKYHQLMTGTMPRVIVDQNGERIEFATSNRGGLYSYIQSLKSLLPDEYSIASRITKPIGFFF
jgi:hypothetical protein